MVAANSAYHRDLVNFPPIVRYAGVYHGGLCAVNPILNFPHNQNACLYIFSFFRKKELLLSLQQLFCWKI